MKNHYVKSWKFYQTQNKIKNIKKIIVAIVLYFIIFISLHLLINLI